MRTIRLLLIRVFAIGVCMAAFGVLFWVLKIALIEKTAAAIAIIAGAVIGVGSEIVLRRFFA